MDQHDAHAHAQQHAHEGSPAHAPGNRTAAPSAWLWLLLLLLVTLAYYPALKGQLLWDDAGHVTHSTLQSWDGLVRIWAEPGATQQYYPLLHSAFWLEHRLWGDATLGYHLINVLWHATSAFLLIVLLRRLAVPGALLAGLVFALHPVCVESVAWICEQKNTLSTVFYLAAALAWLRFDEGRKSSHYALATLLFTAALLTKTVTASLPAALLVVVWWRRGSLRWKADVLPLLPWLLLGLGCGLGTAWMESNQIGAKGADFDLSLVERTLLAARVPWFYLSKLLWPADIAFFYERWDISATQLLQWTFPLASLGLLTAFFVLRRRNRAPLATALLFGGTLVPVMGFVNVYPFIFSYVADHFQYLACPAVVAFVCAAATSVHSSLKWPRWTALVMSAALLFTLASLTWRQSHHYRNDIALFTDTVKQTPSSWVANLNLGVALADEGKAGEALPFLVKARELKPDFAETLNTLGNVLNQLGRAQEARTQLEQAIALQPKFAEAHNTLGACLMALGNVDQGIHSFRRAMELQPSLQTARVNLAWALGQHGQLEESLRLFQEAQQRSPSDATLQMKWGHILASNGKVLESIARFRKAAELAPENPGIHYTLAVSLLRMGEVRQAAAEFEATLGLAPEHAGALEGLARIEQLLQSQGN